MRGPVLLPPAPPRFPSPEEHALAEPNGLLAFGGALTLPWLLLAYNNGIFPWFNDDSQPIIWWSPDPRAVLWPERLKVSRSLRKRLRQQRFEISFDSAFPAVIHGCAAPADNRPGTWLTPAMQAAYIDLHEAGIAHSVECWQDGSLAGGLYGVSLGRMFFGESMFSRRTDASKVALVALVERLKHWQFELIDCQVLNPHTESLGAEELPRRTFLQRVRDNQLAPTRLGNWANLDVPTVADAVTAVLDSAGIRAQDRGHE